MGNNDKSSQCSGCTPLSRRKNMKVVDEPVKGDTLDAFVAGAGASDTSTCTEFSIEEDESSSSLINCSPKLNRRLDVLQEDSLKDSSTTLYESKSSLNSYRCAYSDVKIPKIDTSTAYILFYERSGLDYKPYLPNVVSNGQTIVPEVELEENESELRKQLCSIQ